MGDRSWLKVLEAHDRLVRRASERNSGYVVKSQGDGFMVAFAAAPEALLAALGIQRALETPPRSLRGKRVAVRIGLHTGERRRRTETCSGATWPSPRESPTRRRAARSWSRRGERGGRRGRRTFSEAREVELKGLPGTHLVAVEWRDSD